MLKNGEQKTPSKIKQKGNETEHMNEVIVGVVLNMNNEQRQGSKLIGKKWKMLIMSWEIINERIIRLGLSCGTKDTVLGVYVTTK